MRMYPSYKLGDVLDEYGITFFTLLNEGYRLQFEKYLILAQIGLFENMKPAHIRKFLKQLEWAAKDPADILKMNVGTSDSATNVKDFLGRV